MHRFHGKPLNPTSHCLQIGLQRLQGGRSLTLMWRGFLLAQQPMSKSEMFSLLLPHFRALMKKTFLIQKKEERKTESDHWPTTCWHPAGWAPGNSSSQELGEVAQINSDLLLWGDFFIHFSQRPLALLIVVPLVHCPHHLWSEYWSCTLLGDCQPS